MNLTILSLISTSIYSHSPFYFGNHIESSNCYFRRFFAPIFYNQQSFIIRSTKFQYGLGGVINKEQIQKSDIIEDKVYGKYQSMIYEKESLVKAMQFDKDGSVTKASFSIIDCTFTSITFNEYIIRVYSQSVSFYITDTTLSSSNGNKNPIYLDNNRCNTITHVCLNNVRSKDAGGGSCFVYSKAQQTDFFILTYSTAVGFLDEEKGIAYTVYCNSGQHYHRCNNYTNQVEKNGLLGMDAAWCFSCGMQTMYNIKGPLFKVSGDLKHFNTKTDRKHIIYEMISATKLIGSGDYPGLIRIEIKNGPQFDIYINNCVFNDVTFNDPKLFTIDQNIGNTLNVVIYMNGCAFDDRFQLFDYGGKESQVTIGSNDYRMVSADQITPIAIAHYTNDACKGGVVPDAEVIAKGCHVDRCYDGSNCNSTIGFPSDVAPYKTKFYPDIQTPTPFPTNEFSCTESFTKSVTFTKSQMFTYSASFTDSKKFSPSKSFTPSVSFTKSQSFTNSELFTKSNNFTSSLLFIPSAKFTKSNSFTTSQFFTSSVKFTKSQMFTSSGTFTASVKFTSSRSFTPSLYFSSSSKFTNSKSFTPSLSFTPSVKFTSSQSFTQSLLFTQSEKFTSSNNFDIIIPATEKPPKTETPKPTKTPSWSPSFSPSPSKSLSPKKTETESRLFSESNFFSESGFFEDSSEGKKKSKEFKVWILVVVIEVSVFLTIAAIFSIRSYYRHRMLSVANFDNDDKEERNVNENFETNNDTSTTDTQTNVFELSD